MQALEDRAVESRMVPVCMACHERPAIKTDARGRLTCARCIGDSHSPIVNSGRKWGRNEPCPCGSKKKFKACCYSKFRR